VIGQNKTVNWDRLIPKWKIRLCIITMFGWDFQTSWGFNVTTEWSIEPVQSRIVDTVIIQLQMYKK
jgi:hypothetical protein